MILTAIIPDVNSYRSPSPSICLLMPNQHILHLINPIAKLQMQMNNCLVIGRYMCLHFYIPALSGRIQVRKKRQKAKSSPSSMIQHSSQDSVTDCIFLINVYSKSSWRIFIISNTYMSVLLEKIRDQFAYRFPAISFPK